LLLSDATVDPIVGVKWENVSYGFSKAFHITLMPLHGHIDEDVSKYSAPNAMRAAFQYYRAFPGM
jgi:hypothetical protein